MVEKKKNNKVLIALIIILMLVIAGLIFYIVYDKQINTEKIENTKEEIQEENNKQEEMVSLNIEDESIKALFNNSHQNVIIGIDENIFNNSYLNVEDMDQNYKVNIASALFESKKDTYESENVYVSEYDEKYVKSGYEQIFGPNTYKTMSSFSLGCGDYIYNSSTKKYQNKDGNNCGGTTIFSETEEMIKATKYEDRIEIVSAVVFIDGGTNSMYKDYNKTQKIKDLTEDELVNTVDNPREERLKSYVLENKDNLQQYTYTYKLNDNGFYYYAGVERTKE